MATWESVRSVLRELPAMEEDPPGRMPAFRVRGKLVAYMPGTARSQPPEFEGDEVLVVRVDHHERAALIHEDPRTFAVTPHYQAYSGVLVRLPSVDDEQLRELLIEAWRMMAPKRLVREVDESAR